MIFFSKILKRINWSQISVKNQLLTIFSFCFILSSISSIVINVALKLPLEINIVVFIVLIIHSIAFYSSIRNLISNRGRFVYLATLVTLLPLAWIYNGGLVGSIPMYFFVYFTTSILSLTRNFRNYFISYIIFITLISLYIQAFHKEIIIPYESEAAQLFDMKLSFVQVIITLIILAIIYTNINDDIQNKLTRHKERLEESYTKLEIAKEKADEAAIAKTNFITNISHEIRTPLTAIIGISELLSSSSTLNKDQKLLVQSLNSSSKTLLELVTDLLDLSKIESNKLTLNNEVFIFREMIEEINDLMTLQIQDENLILKTSISDNIPNYVLLDRNKYKQILINLLSNAIKFTKKGSVNCFISFDPNSSILTTEVIDTGIGIDQKYFDELFTPFTQLNTPKEINNNGVGMGLTISKKMVELMDGKISLTSTLGKGTSFIFNVPILSKEKQQNKIILDPLQFPKTKPLHILIVEDHKINQIVLLKMIEKLQHSFQVANNGQEAIDLCKKNKYDAVLMDIQMPIMNGIEATKVIIQNCENDGQIPPKIIICSANVLQVNNELQVNELITDFLIKPINLEQLNAVLSKI